MTSPKQDKPIDKNPKPKEVPPPTPPTPQKPKGIIDIYPPPDPSSM